jgi:hypothetical protein
MMKFGVVPQVRVEPLLGNESETLQQKADTRSEFVKDSEENTVEFARVRSQFFERGQAAWDKWRRLFEQLSPIYK